MIMNNPFRYFNSSPEVIRLAVMMYIRYPLSLRQVEDIMRGIDICHETVRYWWNRFSPMFAGEIRKRRVHGRNGSNWRWHLDEVFVRINGATHYLWRTVDHAGEVLEVFVTQTAGSAGSAEVSEAHAEDGMDGRGQPLPTGCDLIQLRCRRSEILGGRNASVG